MHAGSVERVQIEKYTVQWRIQDFPNWGTPTPKLGLFCESFAKNYMKMKELGPWGASLVPPTPPPPPLGSANAESILFRAS